MLPYIISHDKPITVQIKHYLGLSAEDVDGVVVAVDFLLCLLCVLLLEDDADFLPPSSEDFFFSFEPVAEVEEEFCSCFFFFFLPFCLLLFDVFFDFFLAAAASGLYSIASGVTASPVVSKPSMRRKALLRNSGRHALTIALIARRRLLMKLGTNWTIFYLYRLPIKLSK